MNTLTLLDSSANFRVIRSEPQGIGGSPPPKETRPESKVGQYDDTFYGEQIMVEDLFFKKAWFCLFSIR